MSRDRIHERLGRRNIRTLFVAITSVLIIFGVWFAWEFWTAFPDERTTIITSTNPIEVSSWDTKRQALTIFTISPDVFIDGVFGVGSLPASSLFRLETMDKTKKGLLALSLQDALGTPLFIGDLSPLLRLRFAFILRTVRPDGVTRIDLSSLGAYRSVPLPDGTSVSSFDTNRFDTGVGALLEVDSIRREGLRIRVVNTTDVVGLGNRAARIVSHAGMVVIMVESETPAMKECTITAKQSLWGSKSVSFIKTFFNCSVASGSEDEQAELTVRLGRDYADRFLPP